MNLDFMKEFGNVFSRQVNACPANIKLDPFSDHTLIGVQSEALPTFKGKPTFAVFAGEGTINVAQLFNGLIYVTTEHDLQSGFEKAFQKDPFYPDPVIQVAVKNNDIVFLTYDEKVFSATH